ncbi:MAG: TonB-dependent receptor [Candidatus Polarisedimenticolia bacterium]
MLDGCLALWMTWLTLSREGGLPQRFVEQVVVESRADDLVGTADSATEGTVGRTDLEGRSLLRPAELLETVPGVIVTQHSGSGKANQYYLRGFNLDHGTDFRTTVDGMPVNMPSHGHGQGYSDLNFLIPELVAGVAYRKGPYTPRDGDFSAAGSASLDVMNTLARPLVQLSTGPYDRRRALAAASMPVSGGAILGGFELLHDDGPWENPDDFRKINGLVRFSHAGAQDELTVTLMGYAGEWNSTDQIPRRAVMNGSLDRFGAVDPSDGGESSRYSLSGTWTHSTGSGRTAVSAYVIDYDLELFSNFTYVLDDPVNGDQFEQNDSRLVAGLETSYAWDRQVRGRGVSNIVGLQYRRDGISNGLFHTRERERLSTTREDDILQSSAGAYLENRVAWTDTLRTLAGLRADHYEASVESDLEVSSGSADDFLLSPKLSLVAGPWKETEIYLNFGYGFHSNDARGATIRVDPKTGLPAEPVDPLVRAQGADVGVRTGLLPGLQSSLSLFALELDSELVFVGDAGTTEAGRPSRRTGIEVANFYRARPWLSLDLDLALSRSRFTDDDPAGDRIPGSVETVLTAGATVQGLHRFFGDLRLRYFGPRPLIEDDSVRSEATTLVNASMGYELPGGVRMGLQVFNLLNEEASDIDYVYESRLPSEAAPVKDIHFHPAEPRSIRVMVEVGLR